MSVIVYYLLIPFAAEVVTPHDITCEPHVVQFSDRSGYPTRLNVWLKAVNMPADKGSDFNVIAYFRKDGKKWHKSILKSMSEYIPNEIVEIDQNVNKHWDDCYIAYCFYKESKRKCELGKDTLYDMINLKYSEELTNSDCIAGRCELTVDLKNYCKKSNTVDSILQPPLDTGTHHSLCRGNCPLPGFKRGSDEDSPKLSVQNLGTGDYESQVIITCSVVGLKFDLLNLYQYKKSGNKYDVLKIVQHLKDDKGEIALTLNKTLVKSDKNSVFYCTKERPDGSASVVKGNVEKLRGGDYKYQSQNPADTASVTVEPATDIALFSRDKPLSLVCRGTTLLDDRKLTWYILDQNTSEIEVPEPSSQLYDRETNENRLTLCLNDTHDSKSLFCAQDYHLVVEHADGHRSVERYGVLATTEYIKLKLHEEIQEAQTGLVCGLVVGIAVFLVVAAVVTRRLRRRETMEGSSHEENQYATAAELTYAVLDLPDSGAGAPAMKGHDNSSPYVQIVGVYNPRK